MTKDYNNIINEFSVELLKDRRISKVDVDSKQQTLKICMNDEMSRDDCLSIHKRVITLSREVRELGWEITCLCGIKSDPVLIPTSRKFPPEGDESNG